MGTIRDDEKVIPTVSWLHVLPVDTGMTLQTDMERVRARVADLVAACIESVWRLLPDQCEGEGCPRQGVRGNENRVGGRLLCDDCSVHTMTGHIAKRPQWKRTQAPALHLHLWEESGAIEGRLLVDTNVPLIDEYDEYYQYGMDLDGKWLELRIMKPGAYQATEGELKGETN